MSNQLDLYYNISEIKQKAFRMTIHRILTQDARIISPKLKGTHSSLLLNTDNKEGNFKYHYRISWFGFWKHSCCLKWKKNETTEKRYQISSKLDEEQLYQVNQEHT